MFTASKLEGELGALKRRLGLTFIRFEDAAVELEPFVRAHAFDTAAGLARQLLQHFKDVSRPPPGAARRLGFSLKVLELNVDNE
ncbi:jg9243 [Pararge aegeria aegeria]|uniref:Jg9243 protein n=1 Tax=Pararge aegeria aegeria TaxID=348720 RepID=A0A8S4SNZ4_9NEOP|nr:jg9243 [Pararge aegeria aegeria]